MPIGNRTTQTPKIKLSNLRKILNVSGCHSCQPDMRRYIYLLFVDSLSTCVLLLDEPHCYDRRISRIVSKKPGDAQNKSGTKEMESVRKESAAKYKWEMERAR